MCSRRIFSGWLGINNCSETVFLESVDTFAIYKSVEEWFELMDFIIQKVSEESATKYYYWWSSAYVFVRQMLEKKYKKLFRSSCVAHCINMLNYVDN